MRIISVMMQRIACPPLSSPMFDFTIELYDKRFLDPKFSSIDAMLKLLTRRHLISMKPCTK